MEEPSLKFAPKKRISRVELFSNSFTKMLVWMSEIDYSLGSVLVSVWDGAQVMHERGVGFVVRLSGGVRNVFR